MKKFPSYINPENIKNFKEIREEREFVRFKKQILEFMLTDKFISGENRAFELADVNGQVMFQDSLVEKCISELKELGWESKKWRTSLCIYPPTEVPKIFKYEVLDV
jgi:hypothetical protein